MKIHREIQHRFHSLILFFSLFLLAMITNEHIKDISERVEKLRNYLHIDKKLIEIANEEEKTANPDFWNDPKQAEVLMKSLRFKKKWVEEYTTSKTNIEELDILFEFYKEGEATEEEIMKSFHKTIDFLESLEFKNMLSEEGDDLSAVIQITAGAGGTESCDWAEMLMRMYMMWGEKHGIKIKEINYQGGDVAGVKTVTLEFDGDYAFGWLKGENGCIAWYVFLHLIVMLSDILRLLRFMYTL